MQQFDMLDSMVFTIIKTKMNKALSSTYPTISFDDEPTTDEPQFPNVFFQQLEPVETGQTLQGNSINAIIDTVQITVTTNTSKSDAKKVAYAAVDALKYLRYDVVGMPFYSIQVKEKSRIHTYVLRARRLVGSGDTL